MIQFTLLTSGVAYPFWTVTAHENLYTTYNNSNNNNMQSYKGHKVKHAWIGGVGTHQVARWGVLIDTDLWYEAEF